MREVLASLKPYYYYLVGEGIKEVEIRKSIPKSNDWDKKVFFYMSKDEKSFAKIPKEYQEKYRRHFGKVGLQFVCDRIDEYANGEIALSHNTDETCLTNCELADYIEGSKAYFWHISQLKIYDEPKELFDFVNYGKYQVCKERNCFSDNCWICPNNAIVVRPPQSWCYVEKGE